MTSSAGPNENLTTSHDEFVEAGVRFEVTGDAFAGVAAGRRGHVFGSARVAVARAGRYVGGREVDATGTDGRLRRTSGGATIEGTIDRARFVGSAAIAEDHPRAREALVVPIAVALAESLGGAAFHAAAIRVDDRAFVFIGPSGAGKSTACTLVSGSAELAADRVLVVPDEDGLRAYRIEAGEPSGLPIGDDGARVDAILRVRHDGVREGVVPSSRANALSDLRAALLVPRGTDEGDSLDRLLALTELTRVGTVYTRLDRPIDPSSLR